MAVTKLSGELTGLNKRGNHTIADAELNCPMPVLTGLVGERRKGLRGPEDLPGVDNLLGSFRWYDALYS